MICPRFDLSDFLALTAIIVSLASFIQNKKSRKIQIQTSKLEELLELVLELSKYYPKFMQLYFETVKYYDQNNTDINSINDYFKKRDSMISLNEQIKIDKLLSRIEVLYISYTKKKLRENIELYFNLMDTFFDFVINLNNIRKNKKYPNAFPDYDKERILVDNVIKELKLEIHKYY